MKWTYEKVKEYVESRGYELLSRSYKNKKKISLKCPQGHIWEVDFHSFKKGVNCPCCSGKGIRLTYDYVKKYIEERTKNISVDTILSETANKVTQNEENVQENKNTQTNQ